MTDPYLELWLRLNFPWDPPHDQLWKCVTAISPEMTPGRGPMVTNNAAQTFDDMVRMIDNRRRRTRCDVYAGLGTYKIVDTVTSKDGFPKIKRRKENVASFNSLFCDIDTGKSGAYATTADAELGLQKFLQDSGMPEPSMIVRSGSGGMHTYWNTDKPMPLPEWELLAEGLKRCAEKHGFKIDPTVTADAARILRVPTTFNYKHPQPVQVTMDTPTQIRVYTVAGLQQVLAPYVAMQQTRTGTGPAGGTAWQQNFTANATTPMPALPIDQIAAVCPAIRATLSDGGAGKSEPEWANDIYTAAWTSDPVAAAHRLSVGHAKYDRAATDKKLAEKQAAIAGGKLGWPLCATFGHTACKTCPLLAAGKSPIHHAHAYTVHQQPPQPASLSDPLMPEGFWRNPNNHVLTNGKFGALDVLGYPILDGGTDRSPDGQQLLVLKTIVSGREHWGSVSLIKQTAQAICEALSRDAHIFIKGDGSHQLIVKHFAMSWMQHLQVTKRVKSPVNFGWDGDKFIFGDEAYTPTGTESVYRRNNFNELYQRVGSDQPWHAAMKLIYGNPPLEALVATSFAAPLVQMACDASLVVSIYSNESGVGKSTAMKLAQAVWGHPRLGMTMLEDSALSVMEKVNNLKNLPVYWDEMKTAEQLDKLVNIVFTTTQGRSKARLNRDSSPKAVKMATTMFTVASNHGILDKVIHATEGTEAGWLRVFEMRTSPLTSAMTSDQGEALLLALHDNYGVIGALYADFLVRNKDWVKQVIAAVRDQLKKNYGYHQKERFWESIMTTILAGAIIANKAGLASFNTGPIETCLAAALQDLRGSQSAKTYGMSSATSGEELLAELLNDLRGEHMIMTETVPIPGPGRPPPMGGVTTHNSGDIGRLKDVWLQIGNADGRLLIRTAKLNEWLYKRRRDPTQVRRLLEKDYVIQDRRARIGVGVDWLNATNKMRSDCWDMTPKVAPPPPPPSRNPSSPSSNFGSP